jgi:protein TonB
MLQYGNYSGLPDAYRITLSVSVALLAHTLLMAALPFDLPERQHNPVTVSVQLSPQGSQASPAAASINPSQPVRATPFVIEESPPPGPEPEVITSSTPQARSVTEPEPAPEPESRVQSEQRQVPVAKTAPSSSTAPATPAATGEQPRQQDKEETEAEVTLEAEEPSEESSYISLLSQTISQKARIPALDDVGKNEILSVEVELSLMANGALVGAKVTKPSGNDGLDQRVYRAALAASPYPEPPSSTNRQQRFRVPFYYKSR